MIGHGQFTYRPAVLDNHIRLELRDLDYPGLIKRDGFEVQGVLVHGLTQQHVSRLDCFEGQEYIRMPVNVQEIANRQIHACEVYIYLNQSQLLETVWDFESFKTERSHRWTDPNNDAEYAMLADPNGVGRVRVAPS